MRAQILQLVALPDGIRDNRAHKRGFRADPGACGEDDQGDEQIAPRGVVVDRFAAFERSDDLTRGVRNITPTPLPAHQQRGARCRDRQRERPPYRYAGGPYIPDQGDHRVFHEQEQCGYRKNDDAQ